MAAPGPRPGVRDSADTLIQYGGAAAAPAEAERALPRGRACPVCHQHFSSDDARFCPFDGEPLAEATDYDPGADPLLDCVVDRRYEVERVLGEGGMGSVYRVRHVALGKAFALKALRRDLASDEEICERFIGEARTAAAISHHGLVEITDFGKLPDGRPYFVMELLEGQPLSWLIRKGGALSPARTAAILRDVAEAVGAAHRAGIVHRDIKPDNVQIATRKDGSDQVKVLDFGLAKVMGGSRRTRNGVVFGTPHYMSPEQAAGESVDHRADIYSLGIVMYEMLTGRVPFEADSYMGVLSKHIYMQPTPPTQVVSDARAIGPLEGIVLRCMEKKPRNRYQSFDQMLLDLDRALAGQLPDVVLRRRSPGGSAGSSAPGSRPSAAWSARRLPLTPFWPVAAGAGLMLVAAGGFALVRAWGARGAEAAGSMPSSRPDAAPTGSPPPAVAGSRPPPTSPPAAASLHDAAVRATSSPIEPRSPAATRPAPRPSASAGGRSEPPKTTPAAPRRGGGVRSEIVDPWAH